MTKKRFLVTLGLSGVIWVISNFVQVFKTGLPSGEIILGRSCTVTGYPFAFCFEDFEDGKLILVYIANIAFWFLIINLLSGLFKRKSSS